MIKNGFYSYGSKALDGVDGGDSGATVLRDGGVRGTSFFYFVGTYSCCCGRRDASSGSKTDIDRNTGQVCSAPDSGHSKSNITRI
jgi:hypothetical protein